MNRERRKQIEDVINRLGELKEEVISICDEEREAYDNLPESVQAGEKGDAMEDNYIDLDSAACDIESVIDSLQEIIER